MTGSRSIERADDLEREAAGADHDRGAELDRLDAGGGEQAPDLLAAREMRRQVGARAEPAEVDDPPDARVAGGLGEDRRRARGRAARTSRREPIAWTR